jgi:hypothetical protein
LTPDAGKNGHRMAIDKGWRALAVYVMILLINIKDTKIIRL